MRLLLLIWNLQDLSRNGAEVIVIAALLLVVVVLSTILCARTPAYGVSFGALAVALALLVAICASLRDWSAQQGWAMVLLLFAVYLAVGFWRIAQKKKAEIEAVEWREQNAREADEIRRQRAAVESEAKTESEQAAAFVFAKFACENSDLGRLVNRMRALASGDMESVTTDTCVIADAVSLIRVVALEEDQIRREDADALAQVLEGANSKDLAHLSRSELIRFIEHSKTGPLVSLRLLNEAGSQHVRQLAECANRLIDTLKGPHRLVGLSKARAQIQIAAGEQLAPVRESAYDLLGVPTSCSISELKAAYRAKVREWHPDKLDSMAPELHAYATKQLAKINEAYEELMANA